MLLPKKNKDYWLNSITCLSRGCLKSSASRSRKTTDEARQTETLILRVFFNGRNSWGKELKVDLLASIEPNKTVEEKGTVAIESEINGGRIEDAYVSVSSIFSRWQCSRDARCAYCVHGHCVFGTSYVCVHSRTYGDGSPAFRCPFWLRFLMSLALGPNGPE